MDEQKNRIEIRQEELREILGIVPPWIMRWGSVIFSTVIMLLIAGSLWVRFPVVLKTNFVVESLASYPDSGCGSPYKALIKIPAGNVAQVKTGMTAVLRIDRYPYLKNGVLSAPIGEITEQKGSDISIIKICLDEVMESSLHKEFKLKVGMTGTAQMITGRQSLLGRVIWPASGR